MGIQKTVKKKQLKNRKCLSLKFLSNYTLHRFFERFKKSDPLTLSFPEFGAQTQKEILCQAFTVWYSVVIEPGSRKQHNLISKQCFQWKLIANFLHLKW